MKKQDTVSSLVRQDSGGPGGGGGGPGQGACYRLVVLGPGGVGKTSLVTRYITGQYSTLYQPTLEDSYRHVVKLPDGVFQSIEIVDTAGYHQFPAMRQLSIQSGHAFLVVFAVDKKQSLEHAVHLLQLILYSKDDRVVPIILVGNKCDMASGRQVTTAHALQVAETYNCGYVETSAKHDLNVHDIFSQILARSFQCDKKQNFPERTPSMKLRHRLSTRIQHMRKNSSESTEMEERPPPCVLL